MSDDDEHIVHEGGAFSTEDEARKVLDIWRAEGRREPTCLNLLPLYDTVEEWQADR